MALIHEWKGLAEDAAFRALTRPNEKGKDVCVVPFDESIQVGAAWEELEASKIDEAMIEFKRLAAIDEQSVSALVGIAWCYYQRYDYRSALPAINKALERDPSSVTIKVMKACILAEWGIEENATTSLVLAGEILEEICSKNETWQVRYNLGNVYSALAKHDEAIEEYRKSLDLEPKRAEVWKNLASAYCVVGQHDEELACYEKALELKPDLVEAIICKGVTLVTKLQKPKEGAQWLERAVRCHEESAVRWPHVWYWLTLAYREMGSLDDALNAAKKGLDLSPNHSGLLNLRAQVLSDAWKSDSSHIPEAVEYFELLNESHPGSMPVKEELGKLYLASDRRSDFWRLVATVSEGEPSLAFINDTGMKESEVLSVWRYRSIYERFREKYPIAEYFLYLDDDVDLSEIEYYSRIRQQFVLSFSRICERLDALREDTETAQTLEYLISSFRRGISHCIEELVSFVGRNHPDGVPYNSENVDALTLLFHSGSFGIPDVLTMECSRQIGFAFSYFGVSGIEQFPDLLTATDFYQECIGIGLPMVKALIAEEQGGCCTHTE